MSYKIYSNTSIKMFSNLVNGVDRTEKSVNEKQKAEAKEMGLELVSRSTDPNMNFYKFADCGHTAFMQATHIRRGAFKCNQCLFNRLVFECLESSSHLLFSLYNTKYKVLLKCGHIVDRYSTSFHETVGDKCKQCFDEALDKACEKNGYILLSHEGLTNRKIRFVDCGHEKVVVTSQLFKGNVVCRECIEDQYNVAFSNQGLSVVQHLEDYRYKLFKLPCGCEKKLRVDHAADGSYLCGNCSDSHYTKPSLVYLLRIDHTDFSWLKLGFAKNINLRKNGYGLISGCSISVLRTLDFQKGYDAMIFEKYLHREYKSNRISSKLMQSYHTFSGHTECYPVGMQEILEKEFDRFYVDKKGNANV